MTMSIYDPDKDIRKAIEANIDRERRLAAAAPELLRCLKLMVKNADIPEWSDRFDTTGLQEELDIKASKAAIASVDP